jgi:hypothetical protein
VTNFKPADRCRVVEHDDATGEPREGGKVHEAVVDWAGNTYVQARVKRGSRTGLWVFWQGSGWAVTGELHRWRLIPATDEIAATAGEETTGEASR